MRRPQRAYPAATVVEFLTAVLSWGDQPPRPACMAASALAGDMGR